MGTDPKRVLDAGEVRERLARELPGWSLAGDAIQRTIRTAGLRSSGKTKRPDCARPM